MKPRTFLHACDPVTPLMGAIETVPDGARWRLSWSVRIGTRVARRSRYERTDQAARRWCRRHCVAFLHPPEISPTDWQGPTPAARVVDHMRAALDPREADTVRITSIDHRARAAGERED